MRISAPAKINLYLDVLGRQNDGFHGLETIFQTLELADELEVLVDPQGRDIRLTCTDPSLPTDHANIAWRAAAAMQLQRPELGAITISLAKRIPHGAGLGGGSSDAAAVLIALNALSSRPLAEPHLAAIALELGSDVPFFLLGGTAYATGRGEQLTPLPPVTPTQVTIVMPDTHLPTPTVFRELTDSERGPRQARGISWATSALKTPETLLYNRLTTAAVRCCPAVGDLLAWLAQQHVPHLMSGSGAACFALGHLAPPAGMRAWQTTTGPGARARGVCRR